jgi:hypothetical protein
LIFFGTRRTNPATGGATVTLAVTFTALPLVTRGPAAVLGFASFAIGLVARNVAGIAVLPPDLDGVCQTALFPGCHDHCFNAVRTRGQISLELSIPSLLRSAALN